MTIPERYQPNGLRRLTGIEVPIRRAPLARLYGRKIASATTSTVVGRLQSPTRLSPLTLVRMASLRYLPMDPRRHCSTNDQTGWNRIQGARIHIPAGEATETPSHRLSLEQVEISLPIHLICYTSKNLSRNDSVDPGIWSPRSWIQALREMGRAVGERDILPPRQLLLHILRRSFTDTPDDGVEMKGQDGGHPCPTGPLHLGILRVHPNL